MMHYKNTTKAIVIFFLSVSSSSYAYTREDLETWRAQSAYASLATDACVAGGTLADSTDAPRELLVASVQCGLLLHLRSYPNGVNRVLSAALEKDSSLLCLELLTIVAKIIRQRMDDTSRCEQAALTGILKPLLPNVLNTILFAAVKKSLSEKKHTTVRRLLRILIATATRTTTMVVLDKLSGPSFSTTSNESNPAKFSFRSGQHSNQRVDNWDLSKIIVRVCCELLVATYFETLGAIVAQGIQEDKNQLA